MDKIFLILGRSGDVCNTIPLALQAHQNGEAVGIMTCSEFASVLDGINYASKIVFDGKPWEVERAFNEAKKLCPNVISIQTNGPIDVIKKFSYNPAGQESAATSSFAIESWRLAKQEKEWGRIPLIFNHRSIEREEVLKVAAGLPPSGMTMLYPAKKGRPKIHKRPILLSAGSVSSPFLYKDLLVELLTLKYPNFNIIDLATIKAERFYDLLGLYEAAHCLVTVDTGHLHLAAAVPNLPVMALIQDRYRGQESYWHGTAWRPQHHFYCRYSDFPRRALELFTAIENLNKQTLRNDIRVYHGAIRPNDGIYNFPIQAGSCKRDAVNVLGDKDHFPMLRDVIRMVMQIAQPTSFIQLTREDVKFEHPYLRPSNEPCYAYRMNREKDGNDTFFPAVDLFAAPVSFWVNIANKLPDVVMDNLPHYSRILVELFKAEGAKEIFGIYRNEQ